MESITITAIMDEKCRIMIDVPDEIPVGRIEVTIWALPANGDEGDGITREEARARLIAAGLLTPGIKYAPDDAVELSPEERERIGSLFAKGKPISELIDEDKEDRV